MLRKARARRTADGLLKELKVKKAPVDVENIAQQLSKKKLGGVALTIQEENFPKELEDVSAVLLKEKGQVLIAVNAAHSEYRRRFSVAHELGHLILHSNNEQLKVERYENLFFRAEGIRNLDEMEANEFAAALLMPSDLIKKDFENFFEKDPDDVISKLSKKYEVSEAALTFRLMNLGLL